MTWEWVVVILGALVFIAFMFWLSVWDARDKRQQEAVKDWKGAVISGRQT
jgi:hypothetical protein